VLVEAELWGTLLRVTVSDGGNGLPKSLDELAGERSRLARGHGLSIARSVMRQHRGQLVVGIGENGPALVLELPTIQNLEATPPQELRSPPHSVARPRPSQAA
jgi:signal transduction histidine kinase